MKRVTIKKEGSHYLISVGGTGYGLAYTKKEAEKKAKEYRATLKNQKKLRIK